MAWAIGGLTLLAFALRTATLGSQPLIGDVVSVGGTARNFVEMGWPEPTMWNQLRDLLVYGSLEFLGEGPSGLKAWSVLLGTLSVPATSLLVLRLTGTVNLAETGRHPLAYAAETGRVLVGARLRAPARRGGAR